MSNTPQIRFAGFTDAWEQRKLSDLFEERNEQAPMDEEYPLMAFIANIGVAPKGDRYDRSALVHDEKEKKYKRTEKGDFIYSSNNLETGSIGLNNYGNACISPVYSIFKSKHTVDPEFMGRILLRKEFINQMVSFRQGVVYGQWKIHEDDFLNLDILVPQTTEQQKIGGFFSELDKIITLHQRKCDALQKFKKSMLQKMFPQNGESVPEIRFAGFTDAWEQRKVGDVLSESRDAGHSGDIAKKLTVKLWGKGVYAKNDKGSAATQYFTRHAGQFIYSKLDFLNSAFGVVPQELESYESTADLPAFDCIAVEPYFMFYRAIQPSFYLTNGMIADGSRKAKRIHVETFLDMPLDLPSIEEQKKVASYFTQLDSLITLHQRKLETLQKMKKSLLQKMFV